MSRIVFITGGARSGKSRFAQSMAEADGGKRTYIATCPRDLDEEMSRRIGAHRRERDGTGWETIEEERDLAGALGRCSGSRGILVDCLTLWVGNLMYEGDLRGKAVTEDEIAARSREVIACCRRLPGTVIFVANEVGMGIVPDNPAARAFRDLAGRCNQVFAEEADLVFLMVSGIPLELKRGSKL
ncbi:MAG TPA: bifunctional adenosylcobinamide kinase/adenosylcobinamide-phosphate guanylyltransferase [Syntrophales bacterium]|nr:bifunctional adenosylcobinamide kinase/adenosylcobinamide-phosphate guanylyltransferase [Syntrophales bacterium]